MSAANCIKETYEFLDVLFDTIKVRHDRKREIAIYCDCAKSMIHFLKEEISQAESDEAYDFYFRCEEGDPEL